MEVRKGLIVVLKLGDPDRTTNYQGLPILEIVGYPLGSTYGLPYSLEPKFIQK